MWKINEIFHSLQGEGYNTGTASVFIRLSGCNLHCTFCDTRHEQGTMMSLPEIVEHVMQYPGAPLIVLTGGEPSLWIDEDFVMGLKTMTGKTIAIETNGTRPLPHSIDWVTLSPKTGLGDSGDVPIVLTRCDELKVVYLGQDLTQYDSITATHRYLQPCWVNDEQQCRRNMQATVQAVLDNPHWCLSLQTHRILGIQ
ncbi:MAG: radical SAM protein [Muribaculaceae bacterium]|nr:radical SAM protein [Muribaculaceae bacterium]